jgi:uncharacterized protein YkwD
LELRFFNAPTEVRAAHGVPALIWHNPLTLVARSHSKDLSDNNKMSHTGTDGSTIIERVDRAGITYSAVAENIGFSSHSTDEVVDFIIQAWLDSAGHRINILHPDLTHIGIGIARNDGDSEFTYYITQNFIRYP